MATIATIRRQWPGGDTRQYFGKHPPGSASASASAAMAVEASAPCRSRALPPTSARHDHAREQWTRFIDHPVVEWSIFVVGVILMLLSPLAGVVPGPGGIFVFAIGLAMVLKTSMWAKRHYVRFKNWQPKAGRWVDWGLRRRSAKRRE